MKKLLAVVLALVMMFAVCVPAFATVTNNGNSIVITGEENEPQQEAKAHVYTTDELPTGDHAYTVTIPAETEIIWKTEYTPFTYTVAAQLPLGKRLQIAVKSVNLDQLGAPRRLTNAGTESYIPYTYAKPTGVEGSYEEADSLSYTTTTEVLNSTPRTFYLHIQNADWTNIPVAQYEDHLTFVIDIVDAPVTP